MPRFLLQPSSLRLAVAFLVCPSLWLVTALWLVAGLCVSAGHAAQPASASGPLRLIELAEGAAGDFKPVTDADLEQSRSDLAQRAYELERALGPGSQQGELWKDYLLWGPLQDQLRPGSDIDLRALQQTYDRLTSGEAGLERPEFQLVADEIRTLGDLALIRRARDQGAYFRRQTELLAGYLNRDPTATGPRTGRQIESRLSLFTGIGRAAPLTAAMRREFARPNLHGAATRRLLGLLAQRPVAENRPVCDTILGTRITGTGRTCGAISLSLIPSSQSARLSFQLAGNVASTTRGVNGPVVIRSLGDTRFHGAKIVELTDDRFTVLAATMSARTSSRTRSITKQGGPLGKRLIESIARKKVAEARGQANAIASRKAEQQIADEFNQQVVDEVRSARRQYDNTVRKPLRRRAAAARGVAFQTTSDRLMISALAASPRQLGAAGPPPPSPGGDLSLRVHQSALNNLADAFLGGATIRRQSSSKPIEIDAVLPPRVREALEQPPDDDQPQDTGPFKPWAIELRRQRPLSFVLKDGVVQVLVHAAKIQAGEEEFRGWDLQFTYRPIRDGGRWYAELEGAIEVLPTNFDPEAPGARLGSKQRALRSNLSDQLSKRLRDDPSFPRRPEIKPIDLNRLEKPGLNYLFLGAATADDAWLTLSFTAG